MGKQQKKCNYVLAIILISFILLTLFILCFCPPSLVQTGLKYSSHDRYSENIVHQYTQYTNKLSTFGNNILKIRMLQQQGNGTFNLWDTKSIQKNVYMILLIVGLCLLGLGLLLCCSVLLFKCFCQDDFNNSRIGRIIGNGNKITNQDNSNVQLQIFAPTLHYDIFVKQVGQPLHDNCVICLQEFKQSFISTISTVNYNNNENYNIKAKVSLTVCGHLLHTKCLKQWINRQPNCPLCRQQYTSQNIKKWESKLNINMEDMYDKFVMINNQQKRRGKTARMSMLSIRNNKIIGIYDKNIQNSKNKIQNAINKKTKMNEKLKLKLIKIGNDKKANNIRKQSYSKASEMINNQQQQLSANQKLNNESINILNDNNKYTVMECYAIFVYTAIMEYHHKLISENQNNDKTNINVTQYQNINKQVSKSNKKIISNKMITQNTNQCLNLKQNNLQTNNNANKIKNNIIPLSYQQQQQQSQRSCKLQIINKNNNSNKQNVKANINQNEFELRVVKQKNKIRQSIKQRKRISSQHPFSQQLSNMQDYLNNDNN